jgi:hypothetical protein
MFGRAADQAVSDALTRGLSARELLKSEFNFLIDRRVLVLRMYNDDLCAFVVESIGKIVHIGISGRYDFFRIGNSACVSVSVDYPTINRGMVMNNSKCFNIYTEADDFTTLLSQLREQFPIMAPINRGFVMCDSTTKLEELSSMIFIDKR